MPGSAHARPSPGTPPISPTQAFGLRAQPGQRGYRKGASGPPPSGQFHGHCLPNAGRRSAPRKCLLFPGAK